MRVIAGALGGRRLAPLGKGDAGAHLRPTTDRVREALFNMLTGGRFDDPVSGARVLDLFAGTGALGIEALSRGATSAVFVDDGRAAQRLLRRNLATLDLGDRAQVMARDARRLPAAGTPSELVFLDPPYGRDMGAAALGQARQTGWIAPGALIVWEEAALQAPPEGFVALADRRYGDTHVTLLRAD